MYKTHTIQCILGEELNYSHSQTKACVAKEEIGWYSRYNCIKRMVQTMNNFSSSNLVCDVYIYIVFMRYCTKVVYIFR